jgi:anti-sigma B factor antagonist
MNPTMPLELSFDKLDDVQVVGIGGRLDLSAAHGFEDTLKELIESGERKLLLDCAELRYVSSSGLGAFVHAAKLLKGLGGSLAFASLNPHVRNIFDMVGFSGIFAVYPTREEALAMLARSEPPPHGGKL